MMTAIIITTLICLGIFTLPLGIAMTVIGGIQLNTCHNNGINVTTSSVCTCDVTDPLTKLNVSQYLLGLGIASLILTIALMITMGMGLRSESESSALFIPILILSILSGLFGTAWFVVGGITFFNSNLQCIRLVVVHVIFALVLWCLSALQIVQNCCHITVHRK